MAKSDRLLTCGIYEKISKSIPNGKKQYKRIRKKIEEILKIENPENIFYDEDYKPIDKNLVELTTQNAKLCKQMNWYRLKEIFKNQKLKIFETLKIKNQVMKNRGYTYIVDALNCISTQPSLILRLFEKLKISDEGIYSVWLNINGSWTCTIIDDFVPIYTNHKGKNQIFFSAPNQKNREIWYCLIEKALAKAYGGYQNMLSGVENYAMRDLTGAPHTMFKSLRKGYLLSGIPRSTTKNEKLRNQNLKIANKNYYLDHGLYSGHN